MKIWCVGHKFNLVLSNGLRKSCEWYYEYENICNTLCVWIKSSTIRRQKSAHFQKAINEYEIKLMNLQPYPKFNKTIKNDEYEATLIITKK